MKATVVRAVASSVGVLFALVAAGCSHTRSVPPAMLQTLREKPGAYLKGETKGLAELGILDNKDFVYAIAVSKDGQRVAFTHLGARSYQLGIWSLGGEKPALIADVTLNPYEFDVEGLDFSPDGKTVVTGGRDGALRFFSAEDGKPLGLHATEEPVVSVAFHPSGRYVVAGSQRGLLTVVRFDGFGFAFENRAHAGEVRALAFSPDGVLYSGGWDKSIALFDTVEEEVPTDRAQLRFERRGGFTVVRGTIDDRASLAFAFDERTPYTVIHSEVAKAAGIEVATLKDTVTMPTPLGNQTARVAKGRRLSFKSLTESNLDLAICDACVPEGVQGVLGAPFAQSHDIVFDEVSGEVRLARKSDAGASQAGATQKALSLRPRKRHAFPYYVNDLAVDATGKRLGVAFSEDKAERNRDVYQREKRGEVEPLREGNAAAIVDGDSGLVLRRFGGHHGVVSTAAVSPDGQSLASGGWDKKVFLNTANFVEPVGEVELGWSVRRIRFAPDGRLIAVAAWTPQNPLGDQESNPSAVLHWVEYVSPQIQAP